MTTPAPARVPAPETRNAGGPPQDDPGAAGYTPAHARHAAAAAAADAAVTRIREKAADLSARSWVMDRTCASDQSCPQCQWVSETRALLDSIITTL